MDSIAACQAVPAELAGSPIEYALGWSAKQLPIHAVACENTVLCCHSLNLVGSLQSNQLLRGQLLPTF